MVDGPNLYAYVRQNPWTLFDPLGLKPPTITDKAKEKGVERAFRRIQQSFFYEESSLKKIVDDPNFDWTLDYSKKGSFYISSAKTIVIDPDQKVGPNKQVLPTDQALVHEASHANDDRSGNLEAFRDPFFSDGFSVDQFPNITEKKAVSEEQRYIESITTVPLGPTFESFEVAGPKVRAVNLAQQKSNKAWLNGKSYYKRSTYGSVENFWSATSRNSQFSAYYENALSQLPQNLQTRIRQTRARAVNAPRAAAVTAFRRARSEHEKNSLNSK